MPLSGEVPRERTRLRNRNRRGTSKGIRGWHEPVRSPRRVQQFVRQLGHDMAILPGAPCASACDQRGSRARLRRIRKPPVGSSSLPVGSVFLREFPSRDHPLVSLNVYVQQLSSNWARFLVSISSGFPLRARASAPFSSGRSRHGPARRVRLEEAVALRRAEVDANRHARCVGGGRVRPVARRIGPRRA
jgi:hypothetical protein